MTYYEPLDPKELTWRNAVARYQREREQGEMRHTLRHFLMAQMEAELGDALRHPPPRVVLPYIEPLSLPYIEPLSLPAVPDLHLPEIPDVVFGPRPKRRKSHPKS